MPLNNFASELLTTAGYTPGIVNVGLIGETVNDNTIQTVAPGVPTLTRKPAGSASAVVSGSWTPDLPGRYVSTVAAGGFTETRTRDFYPVSVLTLKIAPGNPNSRTVGRNELQGASNDPRCTQTTVTASLEATPSTLIGLTGGSSSPAWTNWGNP